MIQPDWLIRVFPFIVICAVTTLQTAVANEPMSVNAFKSFIEQPHSPYPDTPYVVALREGYLAVWNAAMDGGWFSCKESSDCAVVAVPCGPGHCLAINVTHKRDAEAQIEKAFSHTYLGGGTCPNPPGHYGDAGQWLGDPSARCEKGGYCVTDECTFDGRH